MNQSLKNLVIAVFILTAIGYFVRASFANCIFLDPKYPDRSTCFSSQASTWFQYAVKDMVENMTQTMTRLQKEDRERLQKNFTHTWATSSWSWR